MQGAPAASEVTGAGSRQAAPKSRSRVRTPSARQRHTAAAAAVPTWGGRVAQGSGPADGLAACLRSSPFAAYRFTGAAPGALRTRQRPAKTHCFSPQEYMSAIPSSRLMQIDEVWHGLPAHTACIYPTQGGLTKMHAHSTCLDCSGCCAAAHKPWRAAWRRKRGAAARARGRAAWRPGGGRGRGAARPQPGPHPLQGPQAPGCAPAGDGLECRCKRLQDITTVGLGACAQWCPYLEGLGHEVAAHDETVILTSLI